MGEAVRLYAAPRSRGPLSAASADAESGGRVSPSGRTYLIALAFASIILLALFLYGLGTFGPRTAPGTSSSSPGAASYGVTASSALSSTASYAPSGYTQGSSRQLNANEPGLVSGGYSLFSNQGGALANVTILVFDTQASAQRYIESVISNAKSLSGYSDASSTLTAFRGYGVCYGYAEGDPGGGEYVANGVCTKGNVYIQVHLASVSSLSSAVGDLSGFVGAAFRGVGLGVGVIPYRGPFPRPPRGRGACSSARSRIRSRSRP